VRIVPRAQARQLAHEYAPEARSHWEAQLSGYERMPAEELLAAQAVQLKKPVEQIIGRAGVRVICARCGEEIMNEREVAREGMVLCKSCAGPSYYGSSLCETGLRPDALKLNLACFRQADCNTP
jgi:formylmethanofuran dehydrogenase subunit E